MTNLFIDLLPGKKKLVIYFDLVRFEFVWLFQDWSWLDITLLSDTLVLLAELRKLISLRKSSKTCSFCKKAVAYLLAIRFPGSCPKRVDTDLVIDVAFYLLVSAHFKFSKKGPPEDFERARVRLQNQFFVKERAESGTTLTCKFYRKFWTCSHRISVPT